ncbi:MAG: beta galactosidase jelly roll domain-containing protein [Acidobacteriales bacterium]|nr:beta galactosidase jelly roll domain-containing protein [Terriglobales bacterium]
MMHRRTFLETSAQAVAGLSTTCLPAGGLLAKAATGLPTELSLDGEWEFTYTPPSAAAEMDIPASSAFDTRIEVPGHWDEQYDRFKNSKWWATASSETSIEPVKFLYGTGWYRKTIDVPAAWKECAVLLTVGWAVGTIHVWLNGKKAGSYDYSVYTPYELDLTDHVIAGQPNELIIAVDNTGNVGFDSAEGGYGSGRDQSGRKRFAGGWAYIGPAGQASGIARSVSLKISGGPGRISDIYVRPGVDANEAVCQVELQVAKSGRKLGNSKLLWEIQGDGKVLTSGTLKVPDFAGQHRLEWRARASGLKPWSPSEPNLHWIQVRWIAAGVTQDSHRQRFGLRRWTFEGRKLYLNGKPVYLRGAFGVFYYPIECTIPVSKQYWLRVLSRAKQIGMNFVNFAARVCPIEMMEAADELGVVLQCGDHMTILRPYRSYYQEVWTPIVRWTRRYPSMSIYGFGGERNYDNGIIEQYQKQHDLIRSLHPEALVMPQQAIRGIDYAFDPKDKQSLTLEPFPHHAERLARYRLACELYGHYSGPAFGYNYFGTPWRTMEKRFAIYDRPLFAHELFMGMTYLNPDNRDKYTGRIPPDMYDKLGKDLAQAGLGDRWRVYFHNSSRLASICRKYCIEKVRKCDGLAGFEFLGMTDQHFMPHYTTGILDEFLGLKPGDTLESIRRYNSDDVLLLDFAGDSINRSFWAGDGFEAEVLLALYSGGVSQDTCLQWNLKAGEVVLQKGEARVPKALVGSVTKIHTVRLEWPEVKATTKLNLALRLTHAGREVSNDWDFWVFPKVEPPTVEAAADTTCLALRSRYPSLAPLDAVPNPKLRIVSKLAQDELRHLEDGGDVLLLGTTPFQVNSAWKSFRPGLGGRSQHDVGSVIRKHEIFASLPHDGWGDWQFYPLLEGAPPILLDRIPLVGFAPIIEIISSAADVRKQAAVFEARVGHGRLLVSTCRVNLQNPSCVALLDAVLGYMRSDRFQPRQTVGLDVLRSLLQKRG